MYWLSRREEFDLTDGQLADLEGEARKALSDEAYEQLMAGAGREVTCVGGAGDMPPNYDPDTDPLRIRERTAARRIVLGTLAAAGVISGAVAAYKRFSAEDKSENLKSNDEQSSSLVGTPSTAE